jgi:hypothetical protein
MSETLSSITFLDTVKTKLAIMMLGITLNKIKERTNLPFREGYRLFTLGDTSRLVMNEAIPFILPFTLSLIDVIFVFDFRFGEEEFFSICFTLLILLKLKSHFKLSQIEPIQKGQKTLSSYNH